MNDTIQGTLELMAKGHRTFDIREKLGDLFLTVIKSTNGIGVFSYEEICVGTYVHFIDGEVCLDLHMETKKGKDFYDKHNVVRINLEDKNYTINRIVARKITDNIRGIMGECGYKENEKSLQGM